MPFLSHCFLYLYVFLFFFSFRKWTSIWFPTLSDGCSSPCELIFLDVPNPSSQGTHHLLQSPPDGARLLGQSLPLESSAPGEAPCGFIDEKILNQACVFLMWYFKKIFPVQIWLWFFLSTSTFGTEREFKRLSQKMVCFSQKEIIMVSVKSFLQELFTGGECPGCISQSHVPQAYSCVLPQWCRALDWSYFTVLDWHHLLNLLTGNFKFLIKRTLNKNSRKKQKTKLLRVPNASTKKKVSLFIITTYDCLKNLRASSRQMMSKNHSRSERRRSFLNAQSR